MHRLLTHLPADAADRLALATRSGTVRWRELLERGAPEPACLRVGLHERNSPALVRRLLGLLDVGAIPVLAHPRWPDALVARSFARAGVGEPWRGASLATLLFTSGSTADPKVVAHGLDAHLASARASAVGLPFGEGDVWLLTLPLCHVSGLSLLFRAVVGGAALALPEPGTTLVEALDEFRPTHLSVVPTQLRDLLDDERGRAAASRLEVVLVGGAPCPPAWLDEARAAGMAVRATYGLTETASQVATEAEDGARDGLVPLAGYAVRTGAADELLVRAPSLLAGYLEDGVLRSPLVDGWFATGDTGRVGDDGRVRVVGRLDAQFVTGGENVQPEAIEAAFAARGHVVVVVGVPDERWGWRPVAFSARGEALDALAAELLPDFARPRAWFPLPEAAALKPRRAELTALARRLLASRDA